MGVRKEVICREKMESVVYSSDRRRAAGLVTLTPKTFALNEERNLRREKGNTRGEHIPLKNLDTVAAADVVCNFGSEAFVVHQEKVNFPGVADQELLEAVGEEVAGL